MQERANRFTTVDARLRDALAIVTFFDGLSLRGAALDGLVRAAAHLAGVAAGAESGETVVRFTPTGQRILEAAGTQIRSPEFKGPTGAVWLERAGDPRPNDELIIERLAVAAGLIDAYRTPAGILTAIDAARPYDARATALIELGIDPGARIRLVATPPALSVADAPSAVAPTRYGPLRATFATPESPMPPGRAGLGLWTRADHAPESWDAAVIAYRLAQPDTPIIDAADLGALIILAQAHDLGSPHPDVTALARLDDNSAKILRVLVESDSIRSAAATLMMHHSSVHARHEALTRELGYDPRTPSGRGRYGAAEVLRRLSL